jgi:Ca2+-transporting ATPase
MILRDDAFSTIVTAIKQGRIIFNNIRKFVVYLMSCNLSEILVVGLAAGANAPLPLLPLQILFLNMVTDVFPALALGAGDGNSHVMSTPPRKQSEPLIGKREWISISLYSLLISSCVLGSFALALGPLGLSTKESITISFLILAVAQVLHVLNMTEPRSGVFRNEVTRNPFVWGAIVLCVLLLLAALYVPLFAKTLALTIPGAQGWLLILIGSFLPLIIGRLTVLFLRFRNGNSFRA